MKYAFGMHINVRGIDIIEFFNIKDRMHRLRKSKNVATT